MQGRAEHSLEFYKNKFNILFYNLVIVVSCTTLFLILLYKLYRYLFKNIEILDSKKEKKYFKNDLLIGTALYFLLTILFFLPYLKTFNYSLIGMTHDTTHHFWNTWWTHKVFAESGLNLSFSNYIFYPEGSSLLFNDSSFDSFDFC